MPPIIRKVLAGILCAFVSLCLLGALTDGSTSKTETASNNETTPIEQVTNPDSQEQEQPDPQDKQPATLSAPATFDYSLVPAYDGTASVQFNSNVPFFTDDDIQYAKDNPDYEFYGDQDKLTRCTVAVASIGKETMPSENEKRGDIEQVKPSGWQSITYSSIPDGYLYNRCHLIGWQLTGENANPSNLITGTYSLNVDGMLKYEDDVASYVKSTGNHVLYRVTPVFSDNDLVARGVLMEAYSVEDSGTGLKFCTWVYNVQSGITINYSDGSSEETPLLPVAEEPEASEPATTEPEPEPAAEAATPSEPAQEQAHSYVLNTNTMKFHLPGCSQVKKMKDANRLDVESTRSDVIAQGYTPCGKCNP